MTLTLPAEADPSDEGPGVSWARTSPRQGRAGRMTHGALPNHPDRAVVLTLVVDDEPKIRDLARRYLEADGFRVLEAADGEAALGVLAEAEPDIVVLDITMPGLNGLELLR